MNPLISIIVPVYNSEKTLGRCINSILGQTFNEWELLLINDGSTDRSGELCDEYASKDQRIEVFHKENGGVCSARNLGINNAKGKWITFCDSDDYVDEDWLNLFVENISYEKSLIIQFYKVSGRELYNFSHDIVSFNDIYDGLCEMYDKKILGYVWNKLFNSEIISSNQIRFNEIFHFREDEDFVLKYLLYIDCLTVVYNGAYYYNMPDLSTKYLSIDNFYASLSMYSSIKKLIKNVNDRIYLRYLTELTNAFFATFDNSSISNKECIIRIKLYKRELGHTLYLLKVSLITKVLLHLPSYILYYIFKLKSAIHRGLC